MGVVKIKIRHETKGNKYMKNRLTRRDFIRMSMLGAGSVVLSVGLTGCGSSSEVTVRSNIKASFKHGVASGDPLSDRVILWTRVKPEQEGDVTVSWEVATDPDFNELVNTGRINTNAERDYTVKVDAAGLDAGSDYYYRFIVGDNISAVGRTRTLPKGDVDQVKFLLLSCANYFTGYFNVYKEAAKIENVDAALHLGDYIYEYGNDHQFAKEWSPMLKNEPRQVEPAHDCVNLTDYRMRYAQCRRDEDMQALHRKIAFITVWDDHELANDVYNNGALGHKDKKHGEWVPRRLAALQAYFEWMPIRPFIENDNLTITRQFKYGQLVDLLMLDTRVIGRDLPVNAEDYMDWDNITLGADNFDKFQAELAKDRSMLGQEQFNWLDEKLSASTATWQLLGQQVPMARLDMPKDPYVQMMGGWFGPETSLGVPAMLSEVINTKERVDAGDKTVTVQERKQLTTMPFRSAAWDGYSHERERIFDKVKQYNSRLIVLAGDTHNSWVSRLTDNSGRAVGVEFAITSVLSPGGERYFSINKDQARDIEPNLVHFAKDMEYCNLNERGFTVLTFSPQEATAEYLYVDTVIDRNYKLDTSLTRMFKVTAAEPTKLVRV